MSGIFLRWGVPALVTVVVGTFAAITTSGAAIPTDLAARSARALSASGDTWASVQFDMRDATLVGTAANQQTVDHALSQLAAVHGIRSVRSQVTLAEEVSPFPLLVTVADGVTTLSGGLPDEAARSELLGIAGEGARDELRVLAGAPPRDTWLRLASFAVDSARRLDRGEVALADRLVTVSGRANSSQGYEYLATLKADTLPTGSNLRFGRVEPPLASPYQWRAEYDGNSLRLSGYVPSDGVATELAALVPARVPVSTSLALASGAPANFAPNARMLLQNLVRLESGTAEISSDGLSLGGSPRDVETAGEVRVAVTAAGGRATLAPPQVSAYTFSADKQGGKIVLGGFVPDAALRDRLAAASAVDAEAVQLGRGAPDRFEAGVDFVMDALGRLSEGRATIEGTVITLQGRASTLAEFKELETTLRLGAPQGLMLGTSSIRPPLATPFTFAADKGAGGLYALSGYIPDEATRKALVDALPEAPADTLSLADGAPADFDAQVRKAVSVLPLLQSGRFAFDGEGWIFSGAVGSAGEAEAAKQAFAAAGLEKAGWTLDLTVPVAAVAASVPNVEAYEWRAQKAPDGTVTLTGYSPTDQLRRYLVAHLGGEVVDQTTLASGAPEDFIEATIAGLDALMGLEDGAVSYSDGQWSLSGNVASTQKRRAVEAALGKVEATASWQVALQAADAPPVVSPFTWSAVKSADGYSFSGHVPAEQLRRFLAVRAGTVASDTTQVASGEPPDFIADVLAGMDALANLEAGELSYDGRQWSIGGQPATAEKLAAAEAAVQSAPGQGKAWAEAFAAPLPMPAAAGAVDSPGVAATPAEATEEEAAAPSQVAEMAPQPEVPVAHNFLFEAQKTLGGSITFEGAVPAEAMRRYLAVISSTEPSETLTVRPGLPAGFIDSANAGTRALALLADGQFGLDGDRWVFAGRAESDTEKQAALAALESAPAYRQWSVDVTLLPPLEVCRDKVGTFAARNAILFKSGSAAITEASLPALDELADYLALCPGVTVNVEGHTDGDGDADANLALSVSRAEAVVDALIERGIDPARLYAIGYGESLPVASDETKAGKQANRRIAFSLSED